MPPAKNPAFFGIKVSKPGVPVQQATPKQLVYQNDFSATTFYDNSNARIIEGLLPDGTYGMWVSKPGFDVTDPNVVANNELIFNSNQDIFKIIQTGTVDLNANLANAFSQVGVTHNLGFAPAWIAFTNFNGLNFNIPYINLSSSSGGGGTFNISINSAITGSVDSSGLEFVYWSGGVSGIVTFPITYYLLQETAV